MKQKGYELIKARGIAFRDKQKVYTKGSEVGFSLQTIEKILVFKAALKQTFSEQKEQQKQEFQFINYENWGTRAFGNEQLVAKSSSV